MSRLVQLEEEIKIKEEAVERAKKLTTLFSNPEFNEIIIKGYLKDEPVRLTKFIPSFNKSDREEAHNALYGIGYLWGYLKEIETKGKSSEFDLLNDREEILAIRSERDNP